MNVAPDAKDEFEVARIRVGTTRDSALGIDLSPEMLGRARAKLPLSGREITLLEGDAQQPPVPEGSFDAVVLSLILSVVPDGAACLRAAMGA